MMRLFHPQWHLICKVTLILSFIALLFGCAASPSERQEAASPQDQAAPAPPTPLATSYQHIAVFELEAKPELVKDYAESIKECQTTLVTSLRTMGKYARVEAAGPDATYGENPTLLVKIKLNDMRIASFAARFWGGPFAGKSYMDMDMKLVDAATQNTVREEPFNSANSSWAASWNFGASDRSLPSDMGKIMAEYISQVVPAK